MIKKYHRLTLEEREEISRMLALNCSFRSIARHLNRSVSAVSREVNRGAENKWCYRAVRSSERARRNASRKRSGDRKLANNGHLRLVVHKKLHLRWSPEQIANYLKQEYPEDENMQVSHEAIYTYLYALPKGQLKKELLICLRRERKYRRKRNRLNKRGLERPIEDMLSIEERPQGVADRIIPGHWEGDLITGKYSRSHLGTLVERTTRATILVPLKNKSAEVVRDSFAKEIKKLPKQMRLTLTYDQGREMTEHKLFTKDTEVQVYFAHPRSPWERGTNENTNGLVRQFFPKGTDFHKLPRRKIKHVQNLLNSRPRKTLNWRTPHEVFHELLR